MRSIKKHITLLAFLSLSATVSACGLFKSEPDFKAYKVNEQGDMMAVPVGDVQQDHSMPMTSRGMPDLFADKSLSDEDRIARLENTVQRLYESLYLKLPELNSLPSTEHEIGDTAALKMPPAMQTSPHSTNSPVDLIQFGGKPSGQQVQAQSIQTNTTGAVQQHLPMAKVPVTGIQNIRVSENAGTTRVVFDSNVKINYGFDYDAAEGIILISAPQAGASSDFSSVASRSKQIKSLSASQAAGRTDVIISLSGPATVSTPASLMPGSGSNMYRYYFDIKS